jgi:hypothetical protein
MSVGTRGRKPGFKMSDEHRVKIQNSNILNALIEHVEGNREMSSTQVSAGLGLLKKVLPDMTYNEHAGKDGEPIKTEETGAGFAKLTAYLDAISSRTTSDPAAE